ncbi:MAG TPA: hypothetical protein VGO00_08075 [Kofleriaceae bacterium]|nr:hypothetical protein [Kofleriaceae bacterium]
MIRSLVIVGIVAGVASASPHVLVVETDRTSDEQRGLVARARAELSGLGFEVSVEEPSDATLEHLSRDDHAVAALRIASPAGSIEVYCMDPATRQTIVRQVLIGAEGDGSVVLVRAVELVRASLLEVAARAAAAEVQVTAPLTPPVEGPRLSIEGGAAIASSPGGLGASDMVSLAARWHVGSHVEVGASMLLPTGPVEAHGQAGRADIELYAPAVEANFVHAIAGGLELRGGLGVGTLTMTMRGVPAAAIFTGKKDSVTTAMGFARASIGYAIVDRLRVWLDVRVAVAVPRPVVEFAGIEVAAWGRPAVIGGIGADVTLW